jgi:hypothetical protein
MLFWLAKYINIFSIVDVHNLIEAMLIGDIRYRFSKYVLPLLKGRLCSVIMINPITKHNVPMYECECFNDEEETCYNYRYCIKYAKHKLKFHSNKLEYTLCRDCFLRPDINIKNSCICNNILDIKIKKKFFNFNDFTQSVTKYKYGFGYSYLKYKELKNIVLMPIALIEQQFWYKSNQSVLYYYNRINKVRIFDSMDIEDMVEYIDDGIYGHWELYLNGYIWINTTVSGHMKSEYENQYEWINKNCRVVWNDDYTNCYYICDLQVNNNFINYIVI